MGYEVSFGTSLAKVSRDGCNFFCVKKSENLIYLFFFTLITAKANNTKR